MRNRPIVQMVVFGVVCTAVGIVVALSIHWFPSEGSKQLGNVKTLYEVLLIASVPIFVVVETVVLFSVWKFRMRPGEEERDGPPIHGNTRLEVLWTALPVALIIGLCGFAYYTLRQNEKHYSNAMIVNVTTRQFEFEFSYANGVVSPDLYLPAGQPIEFRLRSLDVIHSFFVPNFSEKLDAVPGIVTKLRVTPTVLGTYPVECTELCGAGHSLMRSAVHVVSPSAFRTWLSSRKTNAAPPIGVPPPNAAEAGEPGAQPGAPTGGTTEGAGASNNGSGASSGGSSSSSGSSSGSSSSSTSASAAAGKAIFTGSSGCSGCHTLAAAGATGTTGPNLGTALVPDAKKAGMPLKQFILESIEKPNAYISSGYPSNVMPQNFSQTLTPAQLQELVSFLASVTK